MKTMAGMLYCITFYGLTKDRHLMCSSIHAHQISTIHNIQKHGMTEMHNTHLRKTTHILLHSEF